MKGEYSKSAVHSLTDITIVKDIVYVDMKLKCKLLLKYFYTSK